MQIREATVKDAGLVAMLISRSFKNIAEEFSLTAENCPTHPSHCTPDWVERDLARGVRFFILEDQGSPCGCVGLEAAGTEYCYLERLAVLPEHRRKGFGEALVQHVIDEAASLGLQRVEIAIIAEQTDLRIWYEKRRFQVTGEKVFEHLPFKVAFMRRLI